jgi:hypothetical protein
MSDLEASIHESYDRLNLGSTVYLLKDGATDYEELPDPAQVNAVFKANVTHIDPNYIRGILLVGWAGLRSPPEPDETGLMYRASPREVFKLGELNAVLSDRTTLPKPKPSKLDRYIESKGGKFGATLAAEMARVILERFIEDPRDPSGRLIKR